VNDQEFCIDQCDPANGPRATAGPRPLVTKPAKLVVNLLPVTTSRLFYLTPRALKWRQDPSYAKQRRTFSYLRKQIQSFRNLQTLPAARTVSSTSFDTNWLRRRICVTLGEKLGQWGGQRFLEMMRSLPLIFSCRVTWKRQFTKTASYSCWSKAQY
jgi:hypothetical protein